jgi:hypothetical protein
MTKRKMMMKSRRKSRRKRGKTKSKRKRRMMTTWLWCLRNANVVQRNQRVRNKLYIFPSPPALSLPFQLTISCP